MTKLPEKFLEAVRRLLLYGGDNITLRCTGSATLSAMPNQLDDGTG
jgi:hypothetical protein